MYTLVYFHLHARNSIICCFVDDSSGTRFVRLSQAFGQPITEIYLGFYLSVLQVFVKFNQFLQRDDPIIPILLPQMDSFLKKLAGRFMVVSAIKEADSMKGLDYTNHQCQLSGV